jgi:prepilin-type N-terminal cleavage/methylation domain-containing protein
MRIQTTKPGFTLIELLVVVLLIAIMVTLVISVSAVIIARGKAETTRKNMQLVMLAIDAFAETDASKAPPVERTFFPTINGTGSRDGAKEFVAANPNDVTLDGNKNWMAFLRAKDLSESLLGWTDFATTPPTISTGNSAAKAKLGNAPTGAFSCDFTDSNGRHVVYGNLPNPATLSLFVDGYGKYMDYSSSKGAGSTPVLISAGPDGMFGTEDDIRSDRR